MSSSGARWSVFARTPDGCAAPDCAALWLNRWVWMSQEDGRGREGRRLHIAHVNFCLLVSWNPHVEELPLKFDADAAKKKKTHKNRVCG